jgi:hypothetical protein
VAACSDFHGLASSAGRRLGPAWHAVYRTHLALL